MIIACVIVLFIIAGIQFWRILDLQKEISWCLKHIKDVAEMQLMQAKRNL